MPDYAKSKIYKIICNITNEMYVGSTTQPLSKRLTGHIQGYKRYLNGKQHYITSFSIIERGNYSIVLIEENNCENKEQLHRAERIHIENNICVNKVIPTRSDKEYYVENRDVILEKNKEYHVANRDVILEKAKEYHVANRDVISERKKEYYVANREAISAKDKEYYVANREAILEKRKTYYQKNKADTNL